MYRFGLVGCGKIAGLHAGVIEGIGTLSAVYDLIPDHAQHYTEQYGATKHESLESLLKDDSLDIVCVCTPNGYHAEHCIRSLQANKHVFCESPLCLTKAGAWQILETEKYTRRKLFVFNPVSFRAEITELKKKISAHTNGHPYHFDLHGSSSEPISKGSWKGKLFPGGGALYTSFSNYVDVLIYLFGEIDSVRGLCKNISHQDLLESEDAGEAELVMKTGIKGKLSWVLQDSSQNNSYLDVSPLNKPVHLENLDRLLKPELPEYQMMYREFISTLENGGQASSLFDSVRTVEAIEKIYKAVLLNPLPNN
ncbi:MAG: Gfo/Idh/MocA family protein [Flavisolibacter sp.]